MSFLCKLSAFLSLPTPLYHTESKKFVEIRGLKKFFAEIFIGERFFVCRDASAAKKNGSE